MSASRSFDVQTRIDRAHGGLMALNLAESHCQSKADFLKFAIEWREKTQGRLIDDQGPDKSGARPGKATRDAQRFAGGCIALRDLHHAGGDETALNKIRQQFNNDLSKLRSKNPAKHGIDLYDSKLEATPVGGAWWLSDTRALSMADVQQILPELSRSAKEAHGGFDWKKLAAATAGKLLFDASGAPQAIKPVIGDSTIAKMATTFFAGLAINAAVSRYLGAPAQRKYDQQTAHYGHRLYADQLRRESEPTYLDAPPAELMLRVVPRQDGTCGFIFNRLPTGPEMHDLAQNLARMS